MTGIVCAIRGGPASQPTIERAIELAKETNLLLHFLYVVNLDFLTRTASSRVHTISVEMEHLGEFILLSARATAEGEGVKAEGVIRTGNVGDEIIGLVQEIGAKYVVLGEPRGEEEQDVFTHERLGKLSSRIESETGANVIVLRI